MTRAAVPTLLAALALAAGCGDDGGEFEAEPSQEAEAAEEESGAEWSYSGDTGPEFWGELSSEYAECSEGQEQSPVDLAGAERGRVQPIEFAFRSSSGTEENDGHEIAVELDDAGSITTLGETYDLVGYHFHTPSEHLVDGEASAAELHLVHKTPDERIAVLGVLLTAGAENEALAETFEKIPPEAGETVELDGEVDPLALLPEKGRGEVYRYDGSLTTPPCSEGVLWTVFADPVEASAEQLGALAAAYDDDARPAQPLGERTIAVGRVG